MDKLPMTSGGVAHRDGVIRPGGVTIHRRPKRGSVQCWGIHNDGGRCTRTISANAALCKACSDAQARAATDRLPPLAPARRTAAPLSGDSPRGGRLIGVGEKNLIEEGPRGEKVSAEFKI